MITYIIIYYSYHQPTFNTSKLAMKIITLSLKYSANFKIMSLKLEFIVVERNTYRHYWERFTDVPPIQNIN